MAYGKEYSSNAVRAFVAGVEITRCLGVKWAEKQEKEPFYGMANEPLGVQNGRKSYEGTLTVHQSQLERLLNSTGNAGLVGLDSLDLQVLLAENGRQSQRTLINVCFTEVGEDWKSGEKFAEIELPFIFTRVTT